MKKRFLRAAVPALLLCTLFLLASCGFSYEKSNLEKYLDLSREDYYGLTVSVSAPKEIREEDIDLEIDTFRLELRTIVNKGQQTAHAQWGDVSNLYFYFAYDNGAGTYLPLADYSNMTSGEPYTCVIGGGVVPASLERALTNQAAIETTFLPLTDASETVKATDVVYLNLIYRVLDADQPETVELYGVRFDLSSPGLAGDAAASALVGLHPGDSFDFGMSSGAPLVADWDGDGENETLAASGVVACISRGERLGRVEETFLADYADGNLAGKSVRMYYAVDSVDVCSVPEITEELLAENVPDFVPSGEDLNAEFRDYVYQLLVRQAILERQEEIETQLWAHLDALDCVKKYPRSAIRQEIRTMEKQLEDLYAYYGELYEQKYGKNPFVSVEEFGYEHYGLEKLGYATVREYFKEVARITVKEKMIVYYIAKCEGWEMTEEEYEAQLPDQLAYYAEADGITTDEVMENYGEQFFREAIQYNKVLTKLVAATNVE